MGGPRNNKLVVDLLKKSTVPEMRLCKMEKSAPKLYCLSLCHFRSGFGLFTCMMIPLSRKEYFAWEAPEGNSWLPVFPQPPRIFKELKNPILKNGSLLMFQAAAKDGK